MAGGFACRTRAYLDLKKGAPRADGARAEYTMASPERFPTMRRSRGGVQASVLKVARWAVARLMIDRNDLAIVAIDVQPYFLDGWMAGESEPVLTRMEFLFALATIYDIPLLATFEQPVATKGWLPERLEPYFPAHGGGFSSATAGDCFPTPLPR